MSCRSGCPTPGAHRSWGECARDAGIQIDKQALAGSTALEKDKERRLGRYEDARNQGLQPKNTTWRHVRDAFENGGVSATPVNIVGE